MFVAMFAHVFGYFATSIYLLVHVENKNSASYVFTDFTNLSGWDNSGVRAAVSLRMVVSNANGFYRSAGPLVSCPLQSDSSTGTALSIWLRR